MMAKEKEKSGGRGFASMDEEKQREISRKGGQSSHGSQGKEETGKGQGETPSSGGRRGNTGNSGNDDRGSRNR